MVIPKRIAWTSTEEFNLIFSNLFNSEGEIKSQLYALERIKVWISRGSCPQSIESTASLLELILRDTTSSNSTFKPSQQELRLAYSMALIRFVNSLVDPLQTTYFARSIASLATQLGLPIWFVELRHSATHEDLPGIVVLREASRQALDWLYTNYWLPTLSPTLSTPLLDLDSLRILIKTYKTNTKLSIKDNSKSSKLKLSLHKTYKLIDSWVLSASASSSTSSSTSTSSLEGRENAINGLIEILLELGGLVPLAKKKRSNSRNLELSNELINLWMPLVIKLEETYEGFVESLVIRMLEIISLPELETSTGPTTTIDKSYNQTLISWIQHFLDISEPELDLDDSESTGVESGRAELLDLVIKTCLGSVNSNTTILLNLLSSQNPSLERMIKPLLQVLRNNDSGFIRAIEPDEATKKLEEMERRIQEMDRMNSGTLPELSKSSIPKPTSKPANPMESIPKKTEGVEGNNNEWKIVKDWKPCPIGMIFNQVSQSQSSLQGRKLGWNSLDLVS